MLSIGIKFIGMNKKVYIVRGNVTAAAGGSGVATFKISNNNRSFKITSVIFDYLLRNTPLGPGIDDYIPEEQIVKQQVYMNIGQSVTPISLPVEVLGGNVIQDFIVLRKKGQYKMDALIFQNSSQIQIGLVNSDLLTSMDLAYSAIIETEDYE